MSWPFVAIPPEVVVAGIVLAFVGAMTPLALPAKRLAFVLVSHTTLSLFLVLGPVALAITLPPAALVACGRIALRRRRRPTLHLLVVLGTLSVGIGAGELAARVVGYRSDVPLTEAPAFARTLVVLAVAYSVFVTAKELVGRALFGTASEATSDADVLERALPLYAFGSLVLGPVLLLSRAVYSGGDDFAYVAILGFAGVAHVALPYEVRRVRAVRALTEARERKARLDAAAAPSTRIAHHLRHHVALIGLSVDRIASRLAELGVAEPTMRDELERLTTIRDELRELLADDSSVRPLAPPRGFREVLEASLEPARSLAEQRRIRIEARLDGLPDEEPRSSRKVSQAFFNLVENAVSAAATEVRVETSHDERRIRIDVVDDGPGMSDEVYARATEPFFTTKTGGTGMGLAIVQAVAEELGGELLIERPSRGMRIRLDLPRAPRPG